MNTGEALFEILKREDIAWLSCYPTTSLIDAATNRGVRPVICRQERVGVGIADGFSRVTGGRPPGVFAMQWGPGTENAFPGIATAYSDSVPLLLLPLGYEENGNVGPRVDGPRVFTSAKGLAQVTKSVERLRKPEQLPDAMRRAFARLRTGRPEPVVVEIPVDIAVAEFPRELLYEPVRASRPAGDPALIEEAAQLLTGAERPVILAGQGIFYAEAFAELRDLAELLDAGVGTTLEGKSAFPEDHPLSLGTGGNVMPPMLRDFLAEADVVLAVGASLTRHYQAIDPIPESVKVIHITLDGTRS